MAYRLPEDGEVPPIYGGANMRCIIVCVTCASVGFISYGSS